MTIPRAVTVICPNVSSNALGRALLLAELLVDVVPVKVVGVRQQTGVWSPATSSRVPIFDFPLRPGRRHYFDAVPWLREACADDAVIVSKPVIQSLGLALIARVGRGGMVVDIDDWQSGFFQSDRVRQGLTPWRQRLARARSYARRGGLNGFVATRLLEEIARRHPHRLVSNRWLQRRFGGEILYHVRDPAVLDPSCATPGALLPPERLWVGFVGTPRHHKGLRVLTDAVALARRDVDLGLALIGVDEESAPALREAAAGLPGEAFRLLPTFPVSELPAHLQLVDIVAIPSLATPASWGQIPAKLFDAMAMAKPVVASAVNDIPEILGDTGICVRPGDVEDTAAALVRLARSQTLRRSLGDAARARLVERYSYDAGRKVLLGVLREATLAATGAVVGGRTPGVE